MSITKFDLVSPSTSGPLSPRVIAENQLLRLRRGLYVPAGCIPEESSPKVVCRQLTIARALAVDQAMSAPPRPEFTMEAAMVVYGIPVWSMAPDIAHRRRGSESRRPPQRMPSITWRQIAVPGALERQLVSATTHEPPMEMDGLLIAPFAQVAVDCARYLHPMPATVAVSSMLRWLAGFDRTNAPAGRLAEEELRTEMLNLVGELSNHGCRQADDVICAADAGVENAEQGYLLWILQCMTAPVSTFASHGRKRITTVAGKDLTTQHEINAFGKRYFATFALPSRRVVVELDREKEEMRSNDDPVQRHRDMTNAGWKVVRVSRSQLRHPELLVMHLLRELQRCGVQAVWPSGRLWRPVPEEILAWMDWH